MPTTPSPGPNLARALLAIKPDQGSERYELPVNASGAAWNAYTRAQAPAAKAAALWVLHEAFKRRSYWRPAIDALQASIALNKTAEAQEALEKLVAEHGFRIAEYKVDTDAAQPRLCIQFSERLAPGTVDWAQYFKVNGKDPQAVNAEARQICLDGFAHGRRYEVQVKAGLPSAIRGETLLKTAELAVYVKDRSPSVRATGRGYVLPNRGQQGIPLVTVNTEKVTVEVYRIGDRSIAQALQSGDFQKQISSYEISTLKTKSGVQVYSGEMAVASRLNEDVTTAFPVADAIPRLEPGVYVLAAHASDKQDEDGGRSATQWFIVSDLGLTAINGDDGIHGFVRSLATATAVVNANVRLLARNNEVLGTAKTDSRGYVRFDPGLKRGEGGQAPAVLVAETQAGDYAFLDMTTAAFDLTDRGVKGRIEPGPVDAFAYTDRGVYRAGEAVHLTTLVRTRSGAAAPMPVTLIISRPDGVEHSRVALTDQGLGGRAHKIALASSAMTGTWRVRVHTDPKAGSIAQAAFLVEDFVPERLELKLEAATKALSPQEQGTIKVAGRYLYGPPAAGLNVEGEISVRASAQGRGRVCRLQVRACRRADQPRAQAAGEASRHQRRRQGRSADRPAGVGQDQPAARGRRDRAAEGVRRPHHRAHHLAARRHEERPHRHPAAVQGRHGRRGRHRELRDHRARRRRQGHRGQGPEVGAAAPRPALAMVQPRRLVGLRAGDQHAPRRFG